MQCKFLKLRDAIDINYLYFYFSSFFFPSFLKLLILQFFTRKHTSLYIFKFQAFVYHSANACCCWFFFNSKHSYVMYKLCFILKFIKNFDSIYFLELTALIHTICLLIFPSFLNDCIMTCIMQYNS